MSAVTSEWKVFLMKRIAIIVGSLRERSFSRQLAAAACEVLAGRAETELVEYSGLPYMNQDVEFPAPAPVGRVRSAIDRADGIWIFTPEYNYSYPGVLKNMLDWMSRPVVAGVRSSAVTSGKKLALSSAAGSSAGSGARSRLAELAAAMRMDLMESPQMGVKLDRTAFETDSLVLTDGQRAELAAQADAFLAYLEE